MRAFFRHIKTRRGASDSLSETQVYLLALAGAIAAANAYYIHPIISRVAAEFQVSDALIGLAPALNQIALALGIFFLLPLGDRISNRWLVIAFTTGQILALAIMVFSQTFWLFTAGSAILGFFTITPYLLPAYASKRVDQHRLGYVTAVLATGIVLSITVARLASGFFGAYLSWRTIYVVAVVLMLGVLVYLPLLMDNEKPVSSQKPATSYFAFLGSVFPIARQEPEVLFSGTIQGLSFGVFLAVWLGLGLHLTSPDMGFDVDVAGYLSALSIVTLFAAPRLGLWADKIGPRQARLVVSIVQLASVSLLFFFGYDIWLLVIPVLIINVTATVMDVTNRMTFLGRSPDIRTRLMTAYIILMFAGGGLSSWAATAAYDWAGWSGCALFAMTLSAFVAGLSWRGLAFSVRRSDN